MSNAAPKPEIIDPLDITIGKQIRFRRNLLGVTQIALARELGISFQQIQKYETGQNKINAAKLYQVATFLKTPLNEFFTEIPDTAGNAKSGLSDQPQDDFTFDDPIKNTETPALIRTYYEIKDKKKRKMVLEMMKTLQS